MKMETQGGTASRKTRKTFFTDRSGQKKVICHECGHRKPRSTYYDTCYKGIDCTPPAGYESEQTQTPSEQPPLDVKGQAAKRRLLDGGGHHAIDFMQPELHRQQVKGTGADESAAKRLQGVLLAREPRLTPLVLKEGDSLVSQEVKATMVKSKGESGQMLAEGSVQEQPAAEALNQLEPAYFADINVGPFECSDMAQSSGEESGDSVSEEQSTSSSNDGEDELSAATHELAMDMLQRFNELGDDAAYSDSDSGSEAGERAESIEAAAAYLCKQLKQGSLAGMEDEEEDEGDDWADERQQMDVEVSFRRIKSCTRPSWLLLCNSKSLSARHRML